MGALDELRPASGDEIRSLREDMRALERRIAALETAATTAPAAAKREAAARKPAEGAGEEAGGEEAASSSRPRPGGGPMSAEFRSSKEFREVMDKVFGLMDADPDMGPKLKAADVPQRFEFTDVDMVVNIRAAEDGEDGNLHWEWTDDVDWEAKVRMAMSSETANKYFQGKENVAMAIARRRIKAGGDVKAALSLIPVTKPVYAQYTALVEAEYPHLRV